jgi:riboflavin kinase/FMN adenylyltransferase
VERWRGIDEIPPSWGRCVLTIGVFDGMHRGHQALIGEAVRTGREHDLPTVVMTFDPHPAEVVRPGSHPAMLVTLRRRAELVAELGVDSFLVLPFTTALAQVSAEEFVHDALVDRLHVAHVVVGENFRFGHRGAGSVDLLRELGPRFGFAVHGVTLVPGPDEVPATWWPPPPRSAGPIGWRASWCTARAVGARSSATRPPTSMSPSTPPFPPTASTPVGSSWATDVPRWPFR